MIELLNVIFRTIFFYFFILFSYRIMGKREVGQLGVIDLVVAILIAELVAISIENNKDSIFLTLIPIIIVVLLEILLAYLSMKSRKVRVLFDGKPSLIICDGKINYHEMIKQRFSLDDLLIYLRQNNIKNLEEVEYAFLEPNGKLSIFKYNLFKMKSAYPMPIVVDGSVQKKALKRINKSTEWLYTVLDNKGLNISDIFYSYYKNNKLYIITKNDIK